MGALLGDARDAGELLQDSCLVPRRVCRSVEEEVGHMERPALQHWNTVGALVDIRSWGLKRGYMIWDLLLYIFDFGLVLWQHSCNIFFHFCVIWAADVAGQGCIIWCHFDFLTSNSQIHIKFIIKYFNLVSNLVIHHIKLSNSHS